MQFKPQVAQPIYQALAEHQSHEQSWELCGLLAWLQEWAQRFVDEFRLGVPAASLCVDFLGVRRLGHFRRGYNGFGLTGEIAINRLYLQDRAAWELLGTLLHELLHAWQELHGRPGKNNYHNRQFRAKARIYGLIIDAQGHTQYEPDSLFFQLLAHHGVETPALPPIVQRVRGTSKLKKWSCCCTPPINVRVAVAHFQARCLRCGELFRQTD